MQIDCRNLACPEPVLKTKAALLSMKIGESLEILINDIAPRENIKRFLASNGFNAEITEIGEKDLMIKTIKISELQSQNTSEFESCETTNTVSKKPLVVFLNEESCGSGDVGKNLLSKFLGAITNLERKPKTIICVNNAVFMTTNRAHESFEVLRGLENSGIEILSCGSCLQAYGLVDKLSIGKMSNAYEIMEILSKSDTIKL